MIFLKSISKIFLLFILFSSCRAKERYSYAIKDFNSSLQPYLIDIVTKGIVGYDTAVSYLKKRTTDDELKNLSFSEHPVLRAVALRALLDRKNVDQFDLLISHLDDTAFVNTNQGEWGIIIKRVADDMIYECQFESRQEKNKIVAEILLKHDYLKSAYTVLDQLQPDSKNYNIFKEMVERDRPFDEREAALLMLAKYKKPEDIQLIKDALMQNNWQMEDYSFAIMHDYPNETYIEVLDKFSKRNLYRKICENHRLWMSSEFFFKTVAMYKNEKSAEILNRILHRKPIVDCPSDTISLRGWLAKAIWDNQCPLYSKLINEVKPEIERHKQTEIILPPVDTKKKEEDTIHEYIRWWTR